MLPMDEPRLGFNTARLDPRLSRDGEFASVSSMYRWTTGDGADSISGRRIKLEYDKGPRGFVTSAAAITRFLQRLNDIEPTPETPRIDRVNEVDAAEREFAAAGM